MAKDVQKGWLSNFEDVYFAPNTLITNVYDQDTGKSLQDYLTSLETTIKDQKTIVDLNSNAQTSLSSGTIGVKNVLKVSNGGTGASTLPANAILLGNGTSAISSVSSSSKNTDILVSGGSSAAPSFKPLGTGIVVDSSKATLEIQIGDLVVCQDELPAASQSSAGLLSASAQTIGGKKTFSEDIDLNNNQLINVAGLLSGTNSKIYFSDSNNNIIGYVDSAGVHSTDFVSDSLNGSPFYNYNDVIQDIYNILGVTSAKGTGYSGTSIMSQITSTGTRIDTLNSSLTFLQSTVNNKANKASTLSGYGITDAYTKTEIDTILGESDTASDEVVSNLSAAISAHVGNKENPHEVTKAQLGLGNVDNTGDLAKPISIATQTALNKKCDTTAVDSKISTHNTSTTSHSDIRNLITGLTTRLNALADSDDTTLDQLSEIVEYIKENRTLIESVTTNKVNVSAIVDNLTTNDKTKVLAASQGVAIKSLIDSLSSTLTGAQTTANNHIANKSNPHSVTKAQVGLGNVDNTSDANKPISTATQTALDKKCDITSVDSKISSHNASTTAHSDIRNTLTSLSTNLDSKTSTSVIPNDSGEVKTKYRMAQKGWTNGATWYYKICDFPTNNSSNYASAIISGRIGGWSTENMSYINSLVWNRSTPGISVLDIAGSANDMSNIWKVADLVLYVNGTSITEAATASLYVKCVNYFTFDLDLELYQSSATITYDGTYSAEVPFGTLAAQASTTNKRAEVAVNKMYVNGQALAFASHTHDDRYYTESEIDSKLNTVNNSISSLTAGKMDATNPTGSGNVSIGRKANTTTGENSIVIGFNAEASGTNSIALGNGSVASAESSTAMGTVAKATGVNSVALGVHNTASGEFATAFGCWTSAPGVAATSLGNGTSANGWGAMASGIVTSAKGLGQHVFGAYNIPDSNTISDYTDASDHLIIVGNGDIVSDDGVQSNAATLDWDGNAWFSGDVYVGSASGTNKDSGSQKLVKESALTAVSTQVTNLNSTVSSLSSTVNNKANKASTLSGYGITDAYTKSQTYSASEIDAKLDDILVGSGDSAEAVAARLTTHLNATNPHNITKSTVGLGNVDNTSDANKPVSTATQTALNKKSDVGHTHTIANISNLQSSLDAINNTTATLSTKIDGKMSLIPTNIELNSNNTLKGYGGFIDFHYTGTDGTPDGKDYTSRIIENANGVISINNVLFDMNSTKVTATSFVGDLTGNATSASKVNNALTINGTSYDGSKAVSVSFPTLSGGSAAAADATVLGGVTVSGHTVTPVKKTLNAGNNITITGGSSSIVIAAKDTTYSAATASTAGLMSASDKSKLDGIASGANAYSLPTASSTTLGGVKIGSNITNTSGTISLTKANVTSALGYTPPTTNTTYAIATSSVAGLVKSGTDITVDTSGNVSVNDNSHNHTIANITSLQSSLDAKVPTSRTINSKALTANITLSASDVGAYTKSEIDDLLEGLSSEGSADAGVVQAALTAHKNDKANPHGVTAAQIGVESGAQKNQNAFSNILVGSTTVAADTTTDTVTFAGSNVTITPDATNDKITFSVANGSTSAKGLVQLTNSTSSASTTTAATPNSVKLAYDLASSKLSTSGGTINGNLTVDGGLIIASSDGNVETSEAGSHCFVQGADNSATGSCSSAMGMMNTATGAYSHAEGYSTTAASDYQHVEGCQNVTDSAGKYLHIIGNGSVLRGNSNAHTLDWDGNAWYSGGLYLGGTAQDNAKIGFTYNQSSNKLQIVNSSGESILDIGSDGLSGYVNKRGDTMLGSLNMGDQAITQTSGVWMNNNTGLYSYLDGSTEQGMWLIGMNSSNIIGIGGSGSDGVTDALVKINSAGYSHYIPGVEGAIPIWNLLWENSSPTSNFASQTIAVENLSEYNMFMLLADYGSSSDWTGYKMPASYCYSPDGSEVGGVVCGLYNSSASYFRYRSWWVNPSSNTLTFKNALLSGSTSTAVCIPVYLFGMKLDNSFTDVSGQAILSAEGVDFG